ncbi:MAG: hypothetical protein CL525_13780 [Aequorivita sp.]|nr:hypothetical protein [Aequorivita sp.]
MSKKTQTISKLKKKLDSIFSKFIRLRESKDGQAICFTCQKQDSWKKLQAGHFQSRRHQSTRWCEINVQNQCVKCNIYSQGEQYKFAKLLDIKYGEGTSDKLELNARKITKLAKWEIEELIQEYTEKVKVLTNEG